MDHITLNSDTIRHIVQAEALKHRFRLVAEQFLPEVFGSRLVLYQREDEAIRLLWDGREECYLIQYCPVLGDVQWKNIAYYRFNVRQDDDIIDQEVIFTMTDAFTKFMETLQIGIDKKPDLENGS